jgi:hypothetical protein
VTSSLSDPVYLLNQYEALRQEALGTDSLGRRGHGLALFISRGMAAWIDALSVLASPPRPVSETREQSTASWMASLPSSVRSDLTTVLADMVLTCTPEVVT